MRMNRFIGTVSLVIALAIATTFYSKSESDNSVSDITAISQGLEHNDVLYVKVKSAKHNSDSHFSTAFSFGEKVFVSDSKEIYNCVKDSVGELVWVKLQYDCENGSFSVAEIL